MLASGGNLVPATLARCRDLPAIRRSAARLGLCHPGEFTHATVTAIVDLLCVERGIDQSSAYGLTTDAVAMFLASRATEAESGRTPSDAPPRQKETTAPRGAEMSTMTTTDQAENTADFVIVTALPEERDAVLARLPGARQLPPTVQDIRVYFSADLPVTSPGGVSGSYKVVVASLVNMGRVEAAHTTGDAIRRWRPRYVLLVGIAGGVSANGVRLGDLLLSDQVVDYELQQLTDRGPQVRWQVHRADPRLLGFVTTLKEADWLPLVQTPPPGEGSPTLHRGPIATGDKVVANQLLKKYRRRDVWPKLIGVEMEAGGVAGAAFQAAQPPGFFMIRGVSDLADPDKGSPHVEAWRRYACDIAASYAVSLLRKGPVPMLP
jgi:nucleoside phosphorylase